MVRDLLEIIVNDKQPGQDRIEALERLHIARLREKNSQYLFRLFLKVYCAILFLDQLSLWLPHLEMIPKLSQTQNRINRHLLVKNQNFLQSVH